MANVVHRARRGLSGVAIEHLDLALTTPWLCFWLARGAFAAAFLHFVIAGLEFAERATARSTLAPEVAVVVLAVAWLLWPFANGWAISRDRRLGEVELTVGEDGARLAVQGLTAAATFRYVHARRWFGQCVVRIGGLTAVVPDLDEGTFRALRGRAHEPSSGTELDCEPPSGARSVFRSSYRPFAVVRGWLALKPGWWFLPILVFVGAVLLANLPDRRGEVPTGMFATRCAIVGIASILQDAAVGIALAFTGPVRRRARGQVLSITGRGIHVRSHDEEVEVRYEAVYAVAAWDSGRGLAIAAGPHVFVASGARDEVARASELVREKIGDRASRLRA
jgi:hypothetical protein